MQLKSGYRMENKNIVTKLNEKQFKRIEFYSQLEKTEGEVMFGGKACTIEGCEKGFYIEPTIVDNLNPDSKLAQEEIFGPVLSVLSFENDQEALHLANNTDYGLVTGIWTQDISRAHYLASRIDSGQVFINNYGAGGGIQMPFGGYKKSGFGREKGWMALYNYTQVKNVAIQYG